MLLKEPKVVRHVFMANEMPEIDNSVMELPINVKGKDICLSIFVTKRDKEKEHTQVFGYFLDGSQWYLVDLFFSNCGKKNSLVLSPMTAPSLKNPRIVDYYMQQIYKIDELADNLM